ncbi:MAG: UDP-glucose--hexose-1-phosphate uridylyltransferase [Spirochaetales bacterium]|nr:UDP-glucose--hexose-1-phosphate uridylyltransferase [Spirochaetales bacterium]
MDFLQHPHRRYNPLTDEWILCSPHRTQRPWQGKVDETQQGSGISHDPGCYLCPGNSRANKEKNPAYTDTFVFTNDFSALYTEMPPGRLNQHSLIQAESEKGICRVICYSPLHDKTMALLEYTAVEKVMQTWIAEYQSLSEHPEISYVQIFENKGAIMGCSNPHPHGQIWANQTVPVIPAKEDSMQKQYAEQQHKCLLCDYLAYELKEKTRIVIENGSFCVLVPYWAVWPFEVMVLPKKHYTGIDKLEPATVNDCADILKRLCIRYDNIFHTSFPFSMGIHQRPVTGEAFNYWHFHFHYYPRLLRSATIQKFMVGYEMLAMPQRDITAESAAELMRGLPDVHYSAG